MHALPPALAPGDELLVYCKRGGMRSGGMAWLLSQGELNVHTLAGGYQGFRAWAREEVWAAHRQLVVLGGRTGSGKTDVLPALRTATSEREARAELAGPGGEGCTSAVPAWL